MEIFAGEKFIQTFLIDEVQGLIDKNFDYLAFAIIAQGIETLGAFFDNSPFENRTPSTRFKKGLSLMDNKYQTHETLLWNNLRSGLTHQLIPKKGITLTSIKSNAPDKINLFVGDKTGLTYIVVNAFFKDFKDACEKVIQILNDHTNNEIPEFKKNKTYLTVKNTSLEIVDISGKIKEIIN
jgi:hypothetical protein